MAVLKESEVDKICFFWVWSVMVNSHDEIDNLFHHDIIITLLKVGGVSIGWPMTTTNTPQIITKFSSNYYQIFIKLLPNFH